MLSIDEKSQIQALDRTQPGLPMKPGRHATMTHDYKRHGTTTLFATLNVLDGTVIVRNKQRHRHGEFIRFLNEVNRALPVGREVHAIIDNYATHKHAKVHAWLARHPNWTFHFTPTSSSWLNAVEGVFAKLTRKRLKRGVFHSVADLQAAINRFVAEHNQNPAPFKWKADPNENHRRRQKRAPNVGVNPLETWLKKRFRPREPEVMDELFRSLREIRKVRQRPAHTADDNEFDQSYVKAQRELIIKAFDVVTTIRMTLENHPKARGYEVPDWLRDSKVWTM